MQSKCNEKVNIPWKYQYTNDPLITVVMWNARLQSKLFFSTLVVGDNIASRSRLLWGQVRGAGGGGGKYCGEPPAGAGPANDSISVMVRGPRLTEWSHSQYKQQSQKMRLTIIWPKVLAKLRADTLTEQESNRKHYSIIAILFPLYFR